MYTRPLKYTYIIMWLCCLHVSDVHTYVIYSARTFVKILNNIVIMHYVRYIFPKSKTVNMRDDPLAPS